MPGKAAKITITERQHDILRTLRNASTAPAHLRQRATIILLAFDGLRNEGTLRSKLEIEEGDDLILRGLGVKWEPETGASQSRSWCGFGICDKDATKSRKGGGAKCLK